MEIRTTQEENTTHPDDTYSVTSEAARKRALVLIETILRNDEVIGRSAEYGKFTHNKGQHIGSRWSTSSGKSVVMRSDKEDDDNSYDVTIYDKNCKRISSSHHRYPMT